MRRAPVAERRSALRSGPTAAALELEDRLALRSSLLPFGGLQPARLLPRRNERAGCRAGPRELARCEPSAIGQPAHQRGIAARGAITLAIDEHMPGVVHHAAAAVQ